MTKTFQICLRLFWCSHESPSSGKSLSSGQTNLPVAVLHITLQIIICGERVVVHEVNSRDGCNSYSTLEVTALSCFLFSPHSHALRNWHTGQHWPGWTLPSPLADNTQKTEIKAGLCLWLLRSHWYEGSVLVSWVIGLPSLSMHGSLKGQSPTVGVLHQWTWHLNADKPTIHSKVVSIF